MKQKSALLWAMGRTKKRTPALILLVATQMGSALFGVLFALASRQVIDTATQSRQQDFVTACLVLVGIIAGGVLCMALSRHLRDHLTNLLDRDWKQALLKTLLHGEYGCVSSYHSGELVNRMTADIQTYCDGLVNTIPGLAAMLTRLVAAFVVLLGLETVFTLLLMAAGVVLILVTALLRRSLKNLHKQVSQANGRVAGFFQETLEKLLMVQAMDVSEQMQQRADRLLADRFRLQRKRKNISLWANTGFHILSYAAGFGALVWCAAGLLQGTISFGTLTAVTQLVAQLQSPFASLSATAPKYLAACAAAERLRELADLPQEEPAIQLDAAALYASMDAVCGRELSFSYDREALLSQAEFTLPKGSFAVITGLSGVGKSTLLKLLLGIFRPETGSLYLDCGGEKRPLDRSMRRLFAYVPQGNLLLSGTLRENLTLVKPAATREEIDLAVYTSAMDDFLPQLPQGLDTVLGENGIGLSEGQAQRLAIARAVLSGAPVLLLDESTSALDAQTEALVLRRIRQLPDRTCVAVTHRPAAVALCNYKLEIVNKKILAEFWNNR